MATTYGRSNFTSSPSSQTGDGEQQGQVNFSVPHDNGYQCESTESRKYLTAKYGQHQMKLIRKRLAVEDWLDKQLQILYGVESNDYDCEIDLDILLDLEEESERRAFILEQIKTARQSQEVKDKFIDAVLAKADTL